MGGSQPPGLDGVLVVAKPIGPTSHDIVALVRRLSGTRRVGHGGTLDPFASGVLPVFLGRATRLVEYHMTDRKAYRATVCFGASSTTDDLEGELTPADGPAPSRDAVEVALAAFRGAIVQVPPAYSAVKVAGRRAYALARAGKTPELAPRTVTVDRLELVEWDGSDPGRPVTVVEVGCSAGTYVRSIARDLGVALGSAAYLGALERTASGPYTSADAVRLDDLREAGRDGIAARLLPEDAGLESLPVVELGAEDVVAIGRGQRIRDPRASGDAPDVGGTEGDLVRLRAGDATLVAIGRRHDGRIDPVKVLRPAPGTRRDDRGDDRDGR
ncbi:MAG: tRNA pseudouridine(55) synthase TruB [Chloroflexota bacterium]